MKISGFIFDVDGTFEKIRPLIGMGGEKLIPAALEKNIGEREIQEIGELKSELFKKRYFRHVKAFEKSRELVEWLKLSGFGLGIASSASKEELSGLLEVGNVAALFDTKTSADDTKNSKPDPDIVIAAINKIQLPKENILMVGDTPYDLEAAEKAGIQAIAFRTGAWPDEKLSKAIHICEGPRQMLEELQGKKWPFSEL